MKELLLRARLVIKTSNMKINFTSSKHCTKKHAARAARLFSLIQPMKSLICGFVVVVAVVIS